MRTKIFCVRGNMTAQRPGNALSPASRDGQRSWVFYDRHVGYDYLTQLPNGERELMFGGGFVQAGDDGLGEIGTSDDSQLNSGIAAHLGGALPMLFGGQNWGCEVLPSSSLETVLKDKDGDSNRWFEGRVKSIWSGIIGISADRIPWVGRIPIRLTGRPSTFSPSDEKPHLIKPNVEKGEKLASPGEWIAAGYSGEGMAHAFLCGRAVALQILDRESEIADWFPDCLRISESRWAKARAEDLVEELWG